MKLFEVREAFLVEVFNCDIAVLSPRRIIQVLVKWLGLIFCDDTDASKCIRHDLDEVEKGAGLARARRPDDEHTKRHFDVVYIEIGIVTVFHILLDAFVLVEIG